METTLIRPTFVWTPNDITDVTLIWEEGKSEGDGAAWTSVSLQRAGALPEFTTVLNDIGFTEIDWRQITFETNIDMGRGTLTNILGYREVLANSATDVDGTQIPIFFVPGRTDQNQISNELRWSGLVSDTWETTFGLYLFEQDIHYRESRFVQGGLLTDYFSVTASYGWMDGDYDSIDPVVAQIEAGLGLPFPLIGGQPPRLAPTNYSVGFSWDIPAGGLGLFNVSSNYSFRKAAPTGGLPGKPQDWFSRANVLRSWHKIRESSPCRRCDRR